MFSGNKLDVKSLKEVVTVFRKERFMTNVAILL